MDPRKDSMDFHGLRGRSWTFKYLVCHVFVDWRTPNYALFHVVMRNVYETLLGNENRFTRNINDKIAAN